MCVLLFAVLAQVVFDEVVTCGLAAKVDWGLFRRGVWLERRSFLTFLSALKLGPGASFTDVFFGRCVIRCAWEVASSADLFCELLLSIVLNVSFFGFS